MDAWQKTHFATVTNIANDLYGYGCDNKKLASSWNDVKEMVLGVKEGLSVLKSLCIRPTPKKLVFWQLPAGILTLAFKTFIGTQLAEITMAKHCIAARAEMVYLQDEFDRLIEKSEKNASLNLLRRNLIDVI